MSNIAENTEFRSDNIDTRNKIFLATTPRNCRGVKLLKFNHFLAKNGGMFVSGQARFCSTCSGQQLRPTSKGDSKSVFLLNLILFVLR